MYCPNLKMNHIREIFGNDAYENLQKGNIITPSSLLLTDLKDLEDITNISRDVVKEAQIAVSEEILRGKIHCASLIPLKQCPISSGCAHIDSICTGGFPVNGICEIVAPSGTGKTQMCLQLALQVQLVESEGGLKREAVYISTEGPFPSRRLKQLSGIFQQKYKNMETFNFEDHVYLRHLTEYTDLEKCLRKELPTLVRNKNIGLIIIDSITGVFRGEKEETDYISRSSNILKIATILNRLQDEFGCAILVTNQVADNLETATWEPCLGLAWSNQVTYRFMMTRKNDNSSLREFKIEFAPDLAQNTCQFSITAEGYRFWE